MPARSLWEVMPWLFVGGFAGFSDTLGFLVNYFTDIFIPMCLPTSIRLYLSPPSPEISEDSALCSLCQKMLERIKLTSIHGSSWRSYRHRDDIALLRQSASAGCQICTKLADWVMSIENGPDWSESLGVRVPWGFTIRCYLVNDITTGDKFELSCRIQRHETFDGKAEEGHHVMSLRIIPPRGKLNGPFLLLAHEHTFS